nr:MAG TPA: hypothetical protein [Caudoviricetes sp.]
MFMLSKGAKKGHKLPTSPYQSNIFNRKRCSYCLN